jgi:hypothetical protein
MQRTNASVLAVVSAAVFLISSPAFAASPAPGPHAPATATARPTKDLTGTVTTANASIPFGYVVDFTHYLDGRGMVTTKHRVCNDFKSTYAPGTSSIKIQLVDPFTSYTTVTYPTDGGTWTYCWENTQNSNSAYFKYSKAQDGREVQGTGYVHD